ncbi:MAG: DUF4032 domain-containing protein [Actinomycetaceae bacterium]|nr:DUF4032 domain-containing protein [Actinomycetaceae bacterium]
MAGAIDITATSIDPALLDLPWELPLLEWPQELLAALPRGISRHVVRFVNLSGRIIAVKEINEDVAYREYSRLRDLQRLGQPAVAPTAVVTKRQTTRGKPLTSALVTEHLQYSLPYRALFTRAIKPDTTFRLIDSLAVLLVRLHLQGIYWGDVSLSNTLFRRDAGAFSAYLVDAETVALYPQLTVGQRSYDVDLARTNIIGEFMDLQAGDYFDRSLDVIEFGDRLTERYEKLWAELTEEETFEAGERWRVEARIARLNELGFDVDELAMTRSPDGQSLKIQPKVVDAGHYHRQVLRLTGLDVGEKQGQRIINDLKTYRTLSGKEDEPIELVAHKWVDEVFKPTMDMIPPEYRAKLEPAEMFHQILEHRWFESEKQGRDVPMPEVVASYVTTVLTNLPDEQSIIGFDAAEIPDAADVDRSSWEVHASAGDPDDYVPEFVPTYRLFE